MKHKLINKPSIMFATTLLWCGLSNAAGIQYDLRVDGLACPFCAYGIEKKFIKTTGVESVDINLQKGVIIVKTTGEKPFTENELKQIIHDAGFTLESMTEKAL
jgi:mercuric ion binding protein